MNLVELTKMWKDGRISDADTINEYKKIKVFSVTEEDGEIYYTNGNGNSWLEVKLNNKLNNKDIKAFRELVGDMNI